MGFATLQQVNLETEECCSCGVLFAMPASMVRRLRTDGGSFYCPNGHSQHYTKTEVQRLREKLDAQTRQATAMAERAREAEASEEAQRKQVGKLTRKLKTIEKRIHAGVCPCCNRTFQNLARHMASQHKDFAQEKTA